MSRRFSRACSRADRVRFRDERRQVGQHLSGVEQHVGDHDQIRASPHGLPQILRGEKPVFAGLDQRQRDAAALRIVAQDQVDRVELAGVATTRGTLS